MKNLIMHKQGEQSFVRWIKKRIDNNLNFMAIFEGETGSSKSWSALSIAYDIDPEFKSGEQVGFSFRDVMRIINRFNNKDDILSKRKYKVLLFDEAQTDLSNREWQSKIHKLFNYLITTFRHQNIILLFTSPYADFIDSASMKLLHAKFEVKGWSSKTQKALIRPKLLQYNSKLKKFYEHSLFVIKDKRTKKLVHWFVTKPPKHLIIPYEEMKSKFTQELNKMITNELEDIHNNKQDDKPREMLNPASMQPDIWEIAKEGYKRQQEICDKLSKKYDKTVKLSHLNENIKSMFKKGWNIYQFRQKS